MNNGVPAIKVGAPLSFWHPRALAHQSYTTQTTPTALSTCAFNDNLIRVIIIDGEPWFVAADACRVLGHTNPTVAVRILAEDEKAKSDLGAWSVNVISESGLYRLIMRSDKAEARTFQDWVTRDVLPAIRKDGGYVMGEEKVKTGEMSEEEFVLRAIQVQQSKIERLVGERDAAIRDRDAAAAKVEALAPKAALGERLAARNRTLRQVAAMLPGGTRRESGVADWVAP